MAVTTKLAYEATAAIKKNQVNIIKKDYVLNDLEALKKNYAMS